MNRYVAFLDILGFSTLVSSEPLPAVMHRVQTALDSLSIARSAATLVGINGVGVKPIRPFSFSDTFVLLSDDDSPESFLAFLIGATLLTRTLFAQALPVRGAITFGEAEFIPNTEHAIGKAIIAAAGLEKKQEWLGVVLDESTFPSSAARILNRPEFAPVLARWNVPAKANQVLTSALVINWRYNLTIHAGTKSLFRPSSDAVANRKLSNTLEFARHIRERGLHQGPVNASNPDGGPMFTPWLMPIASISPGVTVETHGDEY